MCRFIGFTEQEAEEFLKNWEALKDGEERADDEVRAIPEKVLAFFPNCVVHYF
jgi:hypothetical protein